MKSASCQVLMPVDVKERLLKFAKSRRWSASEAGLYCIERTLEGLELESEIHRTRRTKGKK